MKGGKKMKRSLLLLLLAPILIFGMVTVSHSQYVTIPLTNNDYDDWDPQINNDGWVVWYGTDGNDDEIFLYDGVTTQITNNSYNDFHPPVVIWG